MKRCVYAGTIVFAVLAACAIGLIGLTSCFRDSVVASGLTREGHSFALVEGMTPFEGYAASFWFRPNNSTRWLRMYVAHQGDSWRKAVVEVDEVRATVCIKNEGVLTHCFKWTPPMIWIQHRRSLTNIVTEVEYATGLVPPL